MFGRSPGWEAGARSDRHGVIERYPARGISGAAFRSGRSRGGPVCRGTRSASTCERRRWSRRSGFRNGRASWIPSPSRLAAWLRTEAGKSRKQSARTRSSSTPIWSRSAMMAPTAGSLPLCGRGRPTGSASSRPPAAASSCRWSSARARRSSSTGARTGPSIAGERTKLQVAHIKLSHSRAFLLRAYPLQTHEMLFDAHWPRLPRAGRRAAARHLRQHEDRGRPHRHGQGAAGQRPLSRRWPATTSSSPSSAIPPRAGRKARSRRTFRMPGAGLWQPMPGFPDLAALNAWLEQRCIALWERRSPHGVLPGTVADVWAAGADRPDADCRRPSTASSSRASGSRRPAWSASSATATACRRPSPTARSACGSIPTGSWSRPRGRSSASMSGSSSVARAAAPDDLRLAALPGRDPAQARALRNGAPFAELPEAFRRAAAASAPARPAAIARWWRSSPWSCSTTSRPCWSPWNWLWRPGFRPRPICSTCCTG